MFRLHSTGLPADPVFSHNLDALGYHINAANEIRHNDDAEQYFDYFLSRNERINDVQREAMNDCIREEILRRMAGLGYDKLRMPFNASQTEPHIPILASSNAAHADRVVVLLYEHNQDLGVLSHRIIGGKGGIDAGSVVDMAKYIAAYDATLQNDPAEFKSGTTSQTASSTKAPGFLIANLGQLRWWRKGNKAISQTTWYGLARPSMVHEAPRFRPERNTVQGHRTTAEHVATMFNEAIAASCRQDVVIDVIGVSDGALKAVEYFSANYGSWTGKDGGRKLGALALCAPCHIVEDIGDNAEFRDFMKKRARAYLNSPESGPLAGPEGTAHTIAYGCPAYGTGEPYYSELILVHHHRTIIDWFAQVHAPSADGKEYENETIEVPVCADDAEEEHGEGDDVECEKEEQSEEAMQHRAAWSAAMVQPVGPVDAQEFRAAQALSVAAMDG